nr:hypothetical protein Q903MT_gene395 [Picea sitchensis]
MDSEVNPPRPNSRVPGWARFGKTNGAGTVSGPIDTVSKVDQSLGVREIPLMGWSRSVLWKGKRCLLSFFTERDKRENASISVFPHFFLPAPDLTCVKYFV